MESLKQFCSAICGIYGVSILRFPDESDLNRLLDHNLSINLPGSLGSLDCMHWGGKHAEKDKTIMVLETIADHRRRFWNFNFESLRTLNDIDIIDRSPLLFNAVHATTP